MRVLVTGADGLLGSNLVRRLLDHGYAVRVLVYPGSRSTSLDGLDIERAEGDLLDGGDVLANAMRECEGVFHVAAITDLWAGPDLTRRVNLEGTRNVLEACLGAGVRRLLFVGSASSFKPGTLARPGDESGDFPGVYTGTAYMESKHQAAELVRTYVRDRGLDAVIVAPTFLLGPYDTRPSGGELVRRFCEKGMRVTSPGGRNFAYAPDVAEGVRLAFEKGRAGETYILGGENMTYKEFFGRVRRIAGREGPQRVMPPRVVLAAGSLASFIGKVTGRKPKFNKDIARFSLLNTYYTSAKAIAELGLPQTPIETAIRDSIHSLVEYGHLALRFQQAFAGKVALVTGASRGVGFAAARALVLRGAKVVITARSQQRLEAARAELEQLGGQVEAVCGDVGVYQDAERMTTAALDRFGRIDMVVNNAGVSMRGTFEELTAEVCQRVVATNLTGCLNVSKAAVAEIVKNRGNIVFISSIAGLFGLPGASIYCATKKALGGLTESLRLELIPKGVHVGVVYLGFTEHDPEKRILAADGSLVPPDRPAHHTQAHAADLIVRMLARRRRQLIMTPAGSVGALVYRISPRLLEWLILKAQAGQWGIYKRFS